MSMLMDGSTDSSVPCPVPVDDREDATAELHNFDVVFPRIPVPAPPQVQPPAAARPVRQRELPLRLRDYVLDGPSDDSD